MTELHYLTIAEAGARIRDRTLSPVDLTQAVLDRIAAIDGAVNAYILVLADQAMAAARAAEAEITAGNYRGPLHGIPIGLKDIYNTAGITTTGHSALFRNHVPAEDAATVRLLREAGAVVLGKLATWEFAIGGTSFDLPWPPARNPWDLSRDTAGSSSGSGAAVASGMAYWRRTTRSTRPVPQSRRRISPVRSARRCPGCASASSAISTRRRCRLNRRRWPRSRRR